MYFTALTKKSHFNVISIDTPITPPPSRFNHHIKVVDCLY